jgi:hypothetical protein
MGYFTEYSVQVFEVLGKSYVKNSLRQIDAEDVPGIFLSLASAEAARIAHSGSAKIPRGSWTPRNDGTCAYCDGEGVKWYEHHDEMKAVSAQRADLLFVLDGQGEEPSDRWRSFYYNGAAWTWEASPPAPPEASPEIFKLLRSDR